MICGTFEPATAVPHQSEILNAFWSIEAHVPESRAKSPPFLDEIPTLDVPPAERRKDSTFSMSKAQIWSHASL